MSNNAPSGDTPATPIPAAPEIKAATTDTGMRLVLPDPLPGGANPFLVINCILYTTHLAISHLARARRARVVQLGREMRTVGCNGVRMLHVEDDVDKGHIENELIPRVGAWGKAHGNARQLCTSCGIPFAMYDPILVAARKKMDELQRVIIGVVSDNVVTFDNDLSHRLLELADSTTPAPTPAVNSPIRHAPAVSAPLPTAPQQGEGGKPADPAPQPSPTGPQQSEGGKPTSSRRKNIDARMLQTLADNQQSHGWTVRQWAGFLRCSSSTVAGTKTWRGRLKSIRAIAAVDAASKMNDASAGRRVKKPN